MSESRVQRSRRGFMVGAAVAGAATAAVVALPRPATPEAAQAEATPPKPENGGGYHVSEHVKRYYQTTLV